MAHPLLNTVLNLVRTHPVRRGAVLAAVSLTVTFIAFLLQDDGQLPPHAVIIPCAIGFGISWVMMFVGTLVWLHRYKNRD